MNLDWEFLRWTVVPKLGDYENVVTDATWRVTATDDAGHTTFITGTTKFPAPTGPITAKAELTKEQLIEWVKPLMGYEDYLVNLQNHLAIKAAIKVQPGSVVETPELK